MLYEHIQRQPLLQSICNRAPATLTLHVACSAATGLQATTEAGHRTGEATQKSSDIMGEAMQKAKDVLGMGGK